MDNQIEKILKNLKQEAINIYQEIKENKNYPHPINMPVGLFDYLENGRLETAYTRTLAYLLDAKAPHGYGDEILKKLLFHCNIKCEKLDYSVYPEFCFGLSDGRFDVFVQGEKDNQPFAIAIEAKTDSTEGKQQLKIYNEYLADKSGVIKLYLTTDGESASNKEWKSISWLNIADILIEVIQNNPKQVGYAFISYYISSIYSQLYGHKTNCLNIYQLLEDDILQEYANQLNDKNFEFELFEQYPSAIFMLHQYTESDSKFDESYDDCVQKLNEHISDIWGKYKDKNPIHNPQTWNQYITLGEKEYLNIGITNRVLIENKEFKDGLWWFADINFGSLELKIQNLDKYKNIGIIEKYKNTDIDISGHNIVFFLQKYEKGDSLANEVNKILKFKEEHNN